MSILTPSQQAAVDFANAVNSMSFDPKEFADHLRREHRTLQQSAFGAFIATIKAWAEDAESGNFDLRNADTVNASFNLINNVDPDVLITRYI